MPFCHEKWRGGCFIFYFFKKSKRTPWPNWLFLYSFTRNNRSLTQIWVEKTGFNYYYQPETIDCILWSLFQRREPRGQGWLSNDLLSGCEQTVNKLHHTINLKHTLPISNVRMFDTLLATCAHVRSVVSRLLSRDVMQSRDIRCHLFLCTLGARVTV